MIIDGALFTLSQNGDIHLSKERLVFKVTILFILMFLNDSRVLLQGANCSYSYKCTNAMTGDFPLIVGFIFYLFLGNPYSVPSEHMEYGMSCMG